MKRNTCYKYENGYQHIHADQKVETGKRYLRYFLMSHWRTYQADPRHKTVGDYPDIIWKEGDRINFQRGLLKADIRRWMNSIEVAWKLQPQRGAIAFDVSAGIDRSATSPISHNHTCTGSNLIFIQDIVCEGTTNDITASTYNAVGTTFAEGGTDVAIGRTFLHYLINPATGTHSASVSFSANTYKQGTASYTGANQSAFPDSSTTGSSISSTSITVTPTVIASNCWLTGMDYAGTESAGAGTTIRTSGGNSTYVIDSNGTVGTGPQSLQLTSGVNQNNIMSVAAIAPAAGGGGTTPTTVRMLRGIGT